MCCFRNTANAHSYLHKKICQETIVRTDDVNYSTAFRFYIIYQ